MEVVKNKTDLVRVIKYDGFKLGNDDNITLLPVDMDCTSIRADKLIKLIYDCYKLYPCIFYKASKTTYTMIFELCRGITLKEYESLLKGIQYVFSKYVLPSDIETDFKKPLGEIYTSKYDNLMNQTTLDRLISYGSIKKENIQVHSPQDDKGTGDIKPVEASPKEIAPIRIKFTNRGNKTKPNFGIESKILKQVKPITTTYKQLSNIIARGSTFLAGEFKEGHIGSYDKEDIINVPMLALDVDGVGIKLNELQTMIATDFGITPIITYRTFSDTDNTRFRLIYRFTTPISGTKFEGLYECLLNKYSEYLDEKTKNSNRLWAGTCHGVTYNGNDYPITEEVISKFEEYKPVQQVLTPSKVDTPSKTKEAYKPPKNVEGEYLEYRIKEGYENNVTDLIINSVPIYDFVMQKYGGSYKQTGNKIFGACPLHGGTNKTSFCIYTDDKTYRCFSDCEETGNVYTIAKKYYDTNDLSYIAFKMEEEFNFRIPIYMIKELPKKKKSKKRGIYNIWQKII